MTYRRSIFLINKRFQLRFSLYVIFWVIVLSFVYPWIVYDVFDHFFRIAALDPTGPSLQSLKVTRQEILALLALLQVVFLAFTFLISVFMSHRIAGPLFKLRQFFLKVKEGNLKERLVFRKKDHFRELAEEFNEMTEGLIAQVKRDVDALSQVQSELEQTLPTASAESRPKLEKALSSVTQLMDSQRARIG